MLLPSVFGENLFDDFFAFPDFRNIDRKLYGKRAANVMKTDVREHDDKFELCIDLPGFSKDDLKIELDNGYLQVSAEKKLDKEEKNEKGKLIRQYRYAGSMHRSFFVGDNLLEEDIQASFADGVLTVTVPKKEAPKVPEKKLIQIEG